MHKLKIRLLFWKIASYIDDCSCGSIKDLASEREKNCITFSDNCIIAYCSDDEIIKVYDSELQPLLTTAEDCEILLALKELFDDLE